MTRNGKHGASAQRAKPHELKPQDAQHVDWNIELRRIERQFDGLPPEPSASVVKARKEREARLREQVARRVAVISSSGRLLLVGSLALAMDWWPYSASCGVGLAGFLAALSMVAVGGLWASVHSWRNRLAINHAVAIVLLIAGLALVAAQLLPRLGYATVVGVQATPWSCAAAASVAAGSGVASF